MLKTEKEVNQLSNENMSSKNKSKYEIFLQFEKFGLHLRNKEVEIEEKY